MITHFSNYLEMTLLAVQLIGNYLQKRKRKRGIFYQVNSSRLCGREVGQACTWLLCVRALI